MPTPTTARRRWPRKLLRLVAGGVAAGVLVGIALLAVACETMGAAAEGDRLARMQASPRYKDGIFHNDRVKRPWDMGAMLSSSLTESSSEATPEEGDLPLERRRASDFATPPSSGLRVTWFGHSSFLVELDGKKVLIDPVWGERASPFTFAGPKRFVPPALPLADLPTLDAVVISHDHYDHLDHETVVALAQTTTPSGRPLRLVVPLGIGAHLEHWGIDAGQIDELDWWDHVDIGDGVQLTATPARHFSGRGLTDRDATLWAGWAITGPAHRAFYSGDTAMHDTFVDIGQKLGPFDVTMIESGAYNKNWADVHLGPEQAVRAHRLVRGKIMLAAHWGLFDLALHSWVEPMERVIAAATREGVHVVAPRVGGQVLVPDDPQSLPATASLEKWWPAHVQWTPASEHKVRSSGIDHLMADGAVEQLTVPKAAAAASDDDDKHAKATVAPTLP